MYMHLLAKALHYGDIIVITQHTLGLVGHAIHNIILSGLFIVLSPGDYLVTVAEQSLICEARTSSLLALEKLKLNKTRNKYT